MMPYAEPSDAEIRPRSMGRAPARARNVLRAKLKLEGLKSADFLPYSTVENLKVSL
jgi:hypothetical protein